MTAPLRKRAAWCVVAAALLAAAPIAAARGRTAEDVRKEPRIAIVPERLGPGKPFAVYFDAEEGPAAARAILVDPTGKAVASARFFSVETEGERRQSLTALLAVPSTTGAGTCALRAVGENGEALGEVAVEIGDKSFPSERIPLDQNNSELRTADDPQKTSEAVALWKIFGRTDPSALWDFAPFRYPVDSDRRTSTFGDRRVYEYKDGSAGKSVHAGIDYGVPTGTPVRASARGKVVFAASRIVTGNSVIIEHLPGVYSLYYHLSRIDAAEGSMVEAGERIGLSGSTGLSTGPHLHWEIRVAAEAADPDEMASRALIDKDRIISKITGSSVSE